MGRHGEHYGEARQVELHYEDTEAVNGVAVVPVARVCILTKKTPVATSDISIRSPTTPPLVVPSRLTVSLVAEVE